MIRSIVLAILGMAVTAPAYGFLSSIGSYFGSYQLGFDYTNSYDNVHMTYEVPTNDGAITKSCAEIPNTPTRQLCETDIKGGSSSGIGIVLQQPFKRQGNFYFNWDLGFGVRYLAGELSEEKAEESLQNGLPLKSASFQLGAAVVRPYIQLGYTPQGWVPDFILSLGPTVQASFGNVTINEKKENVALGTASGLMGFTELEVVFARWGDGAFSVFTSKDFSGGDDKGTPFYPKAINGMDDFKASFSRGVGGAAFGFGLKLILNWP